MAGHTLDAKRDRVVSLGIAGIAVGWLVLAAAYGVVLRIFGVISLVTAGMAWLGWLCAAGLPVAVAISLARRRRWRPAIAVAAAAVVAAAGLWILGLPAVSPQSQYRQHRADLAALAAAYNAGQLGEDSDLPWRMRFVSVDGKAHRRCLEGGVTTCALYLAAWQDWRAESGSGFAYFPSPPAAGSAIVTAEGDLGSPSRELGDGWWWVE
jgi:hypothetical protein